MPPATFAALIAVVIAAAGLTILLASWAGLPLAALALVALLGSAVLHLRRRG